MDQPTGDLRYGVDYALGDRHDCDGCCVDLGVVNPMLWPVLYYQLDGPPAPNEISVLDMANRRVALTEGLWYGRSRAYVSSVLLPRAVVDGPAEDRPFEVALRCDGQLEHVLQARYPTREAVLVAHGWMVEYAHLLQRLRTRPARRRYYRSRGRTFGSRRRATRRDAMRLVDLLELMFKDPA